MTRPKFDMSINLGHVLQIVALISALMVGWVQIEKRTSTNQGDIKAVNDRVERLTSATANLPPRIRALENSAARYDERFTSILSLLARIDSRLEGMEK